MLQVSCKNCRCRKFIQIANFVFASLCMCCGHLANVQRVSIFYSFALVIKKSSFNKEKKRDIRNKHD